MTALLYDLIYMIPLCLLAVFAGQPYLGGPENRLLLGGVALMALATYAALKHWKNRLRFLIPGMLLALSAGMVLIRKPEERGEFLFLHQWILWVFLTAAVCFLVGWLMAANRHARRLAAGLLLVALLLVMIWWNALGKAEVALSFFLLALVAAEEVQIRWKKSGYPDGKGHLVSISPFLAALCILVFLLPAPKEPYDWHFARQIWQQASNYVRLAGRLFHGGDEDYGGVIGFGDNDHFLGNLTKKDKDVMVLTGKRDFSQVTYLAGKVLDSFDGRNWSAAYVEENRDKEMDVLETTCAVRQYDPDYVSNYLERTNVSVKYENFNTKYFFTTLKTLLDDGELGGESFVRQGGNLLAKERLGYGTEYGLTYFRLNQDHEEFQEFLRTRQAIDPETWEIVRAEDEPGYEEYLRYQERVYQYYLPETQVSDVISEYLEKLLDGAESEFDKLSRLEAMLASLQYTETPGALPESVTSPEEFLDYLLLDGRKGYCSYFATAFVLLARNQGIPARYVQGYYVLKNGNESVTVNSSMAHAWPEAYLKGVGWIAFEPTPGKKQYTAWAFRKKAEGGENTPNHPDQGMKEPPAEIPLPEEEITEEETSKIHWRYVLIPLGLVTLFLAAFLFVDRLLAKKWYARLDDAGKFQVSCKRGMKALGFLGLTMEQGETLEEFKIRLSEEMQGSALAFLADYELTLYSERVPSREMRLRAEAALKDLTEMLKEVKGKWFFWYLFQLSRMEVRN